MEMEIKLGSGESRENILQRQETPRINFAN